jgi:hypothetical protein
MKMKKLGTWPIRVSINVEPSYPINEDVWNTIDDAELDRICDSVTDAVDDLASALRTRFPKLHVQVSE